MIVTCTECAARYRVNEDKLPPGGGNIKCPKCAHVFFVKPPGAALDELPPRPGGKRTNVLDDTTTVGQAPNNLMAKFGVQGSDVPYDQKPTRPTSGSVDEDSEDTSKKAGGENWKLKTNFGLVYDFPDTNSLRSWLSARDDLSGYKLAAEGEDFKDLSAHEAALGAPIKQKIRKGAVAGAASSAASTPGDESPYDASNFFPEEDEVPSGPSPEARTSGHIKAKDKPAPAPIKLVSAPQETKSNRAIYLAIVALLLVSGALVLQISGVLDLRTALFGQPRTNTPPAVTQQVKPNPAEAVTPEPARPRPVVKRAPRPLVDNRPKTVNPFTPQRQVRELVNQAQQDIRSRKYDTAISSLLSADRIDPGNKEIYRLLERAYQRSGNRSKAREIRDRLRDL